jgi:hypothetical protein
VLFLGLCAESERGRSEEWKVSLCDCCTTAAESIVPMAGHETCFVGGDMEGAGFPVYSQK